MVVTVFGSRLQPEHAAEYSEVAAQMRAMADTMPGFISFMTCRVEDGERVSIIEFESEETLRGWREHLEHRTAQDLGRAALYAEFQIQVCSILRQYGFKRSNAQPAA